MHSESNIEVHKYYGGTVLATAFLALVLQAFLHKYGRWSELVDLPLLVTVYFGVSRRNPVTGMFLGATIGILQDALSHDNPIGLFGIAKTIVGYLASTVGARIDTQHPVSRFASDFSILPSTSGYFRGHGARPVEPSRTVLHAAFAAEFRRHSGVRRRPLCRSRSSSQVLTRSPKFQRKSHLTRQTAGSVSGRQLRLALPRIPPASRPLPRAGAAPGS